MKGPHSPERQFEIRELAWISNSFLLAAQELAEAVVEDPGRDHAHRDRVPLYLAHHAMELLYKAALLDAGVVVPPTHSVELLRRLCIQHVPDCAFDVPEWLGRDPQWTVELFTEDMLKGLPKLVTHDMHERLRYVTDRKGRRMEPPPEQDPKELNEALAELQRNCLRPMIRLTGPWKGG